MTRRTAILVHGLIGHLRDDVLMRAIGPDVLAPELLGYGGYANVDPAGLTLAAQVEHLREIVDLQCGGGPVHLVGLSIGGAIGMLFTEAYPKRVASLTSIEGNFTLADAFWSHAISQMSAPQVEGLLREYRADPVAWLALSGVVPDERQLAIARDWLDYQPAVTVHAMAKSVVEITGSPRFEQSIRAVLDAKIPLHLIAGERSRSGWSVPDWVIARASMTVVPNAGHLMTLEAPEAVGRIIRNNIASFSGSARNASWP